MRLMNITNGDCAANILNASSVSGDVLSWQDPIHHGPFPAGLTLDQLRAVRSKYLAGSDLDIKSVEQDFLKRDTQLHSYSNYDGIILWFEHDLLDQLQILQILAWFAKADLGSTRLEIICIDEFNGIDPFRGLGQLSPDQMASLFDMRIMVTDEMLHQAKEGWDAFCSDDPNNLLVYLETELNCFPYLKAALHRHLQEFPHISDGLSLTERQVLQLVANGTTNPVDIFINPNISQDRCVGLKNLRKFFCDKELSESGARSDANTV